MCVCYTVPMTTMTEPLNEILSNLPLVDVGPWHYSDGRFHQIVSFNCYRGCEVRRCTIRVLGVAVGVELISTDVDCALVGMLDRAYRENTPDAIRALNERMGCCTDMNGESL